MSPWPEVGGTRQGGREQSEEGAQAVSRSYVQPPRTCPGSAMQR